jgi:uncharacterized protein (TIGR03067 family)
MILLTLMLLAADPTAADKAKLQGPWYTVDQKIEGLFSISFGERPSLDFKGDTLYGFGQRMGRYRIDASRSPKTIDFIIEAGPTAGTTELGIYRFEGESLIICEAYGGAPRPDDFAVPKGSKRRLTIYERAPRPRDPRSAGDRSHLQGDWFAEDEGDKLTFDGNTLFRRGQSKGRYTNDASRDPKTIDFIYDSGKSELGIYKFEGGLANKVVVLCVAQSGAPRPTDFTVPEGSKRKLTIWKQQVDRNH